MWKMRLQEQYDARSLSCTKPCSIATLLSIVTSVKYGKTPRGIKITDKQLKPELTNKLALNLQGAQRDTTLLTRNPTQPFTELNLQHYEILDCEPLHDVKGHLYNLLPEIPHLLEEPLKSECLLIVNTQQFQNRK